MFNVKKMFLIFLVTYMFFNNNFQVYASRHIVIDDYSVTNEICDISFLGGDIQTVGFHATWSDDGYDVRGAQIHVSGNIDPHGFGAELWSKGCRNILLMHFADALGDHIYEVIEKEFLSRGGNILERIRYATEVTNFNPILESLDKQIYHLRYEYSYEDLTLVIVSEELGYPIIKNIIPSYSNISKIDNVYYGDFYTDNNGWIYVPAHIKLGSNEYKIQSVSKGGIEEYVMSINNPIIKGTFINIIEGGVSQSIADINSIQTVWIKVEYSGANEILDDTKGKVFMNGLDMIWSASNYRWELNYTSKSTRLSSFNVTLITETYELDNIWNDVGPLYIKWVNPSKIIINAKPSVKIGSQIELYGTLKWLNSSGIPGEPILLEYSVTNGDTWNEITAIMTDDNGSYSAIWIPTATGNYLIRASWIGPELEWVRKDTAQHSIITVPADEDSIFAIVSNSSISNVNYKSTDRILTFTTEGPINTKSTCEVTIPNYMVMNIDDLDVRLDGTSIQYNITSIKDAWLIGFNYWQSIHDIEIIFGKEQTIEVEELNTKNVTTQYSQIKFQIKDDKNQVLSGALIKAVKKPIEQSDLNAITDNEGIVIFNDIFTGSYEFNISKKGYVSKLEKISFDTEDTVIVIISLEKYLVEEPKKVIPGFPIISIVLGLIISVLIYARRRIK